MTTAHVTNTRVGRAILEALFACKDLIPLTVLHELVCPREQWVSIEALAEAVRKLVDTPYIEDFRGPDSTMPRYRITQKGCVQWAALEAQEVAAECAIHTPVGRQALQSVAAEVDAEERLKAKLRASHEDLDKRGVAPAAPVEVRICEHREPATALLCVDEDELDEWWDLQDVEVKADAFAMWALQSGRNHIYLELNQTAQVPVKGTVGGDDDKIRAMAETERLRAEYEKAVAQ